MDGVHAAVRYVAALRQCCGVLHNKVDHGFVRNSHHLHRIAAISAHRSWVQIWYISKRELTFAPPSGDRSTL